MNLKDNVKLFENGKIQIIKFWISNDDTLRVLNKYNIKKELFIKNYAIGILDYYIGVINGINKIGDCPVIDNLLKYLKDKDIGVDELFLICAGFKNALIEFMYEAKINSLAIQKEILYIYEKNFEGVLKKYSQTIQNINKDLNISNHLIDDHIVMSTTDLQGIITSASQAFCEISGYTKEELIGQPHNIVRHPDMPKETFTELWKTIQNEEVWKGEVKNLTKDKKIYWVNAIITPAYDANSNHIGYSAIRHDITAKKENEIQQALIIEQSKAAAMGEMIAMLAHQWRQPLQAIAMLIQQLTLEKMLDGELSDETLNKVVTDTQKQLDYMSKTIDDFRDFFRPDKAKDKIRVNDLIEKARELMAYTLKVDGIDLILDIEDDIEINVHINEIVQVLINIIKNARDALIETDNENRTITIKSYKDGDNLKIKIKDNGGGIPNAAIDKVFDAYFSTKKNKNGTGLGLYMSKNIIENHGQGLLSVKNEDDGAVFKITLPIE
ncbi:MAG: PAS domain S-box protein [Arcobacteraceae bacterium]|nr:PAS domain S-box protein [Arcobacteraceae bacterium]